MEVEGFLVFGFVVRVSDFEYRHDPFRVMIGCSSPVAVAYHSAEVDAVVDAVGVLFLDEGVVDYTFHLLVVCYVLYVGVWMCLLGKYCGIFRSGLPGAWSLLGSSTIGLGLGGLGVLLLNLVA